MGEEAKLEVGKLPFKFSYRFQDAAGKQSEMQDLDWETGQLFWNCRRAADGDERMALAKVREKAEVFNPLTAFRVRPLPAIRARAGRWLADNLAQIFRHFDEWKLNESHISYMVSY